MDVGLRSFRGKRLLARMSLLLRGEARWLSDHALRRLNRRRLVQVRLKAKIVELLETFGRRLCSLLLGLRNALHDIMLSLFPLKTCAVIKHSDYLLGMRIRFRLLLPKRHGRGTEGELTGAAEIKSFHHSRNIFFPDISKHIHSRSNGT